MRVCVPTDSPGGPESPVAARFQDSDLLDIYELSPDGAAELSVQIRNCAGTCKDNVETVVRRGVIAIIAKQVSPGAMVRFRASGVTVYRAAEGPSRISLVKMQKGGLLPLR